MHCKSDAGETVSESGFVEGELCFKLWPCLLPDSRLACSRRVFGYVSKRGPCLTILRSVSSADEPRTFQLTTMILDSIRESFFI